MKFEVTFIGTKTVRQQVSATVELDDDKIKRQLLAGLLWNADIDVNELSASVTLEVDLADVISDEIQEGNYTMADITDEDIDGEHDWSEIESVEGN